MEEPILGSEIMSYSFPVMMQGIYGFLLGHRVCSLLVVIFG